MRMSEKNKEQSPRVLLIDDESIVAEIVSGMLTGQNDIALHYVCHAVDALPAAHGFFPTVILVDLKMPLIDGLALVSEFRQHEETRHVPMILLSSEENAELKVRAFDLGANDYLVKWPNKLEVVARIRYHSSAYLARKQRDDAFMSLRRSQEELLTRTRELAESQAALHHAQKMEAVGKLTGGVAHDFNNVLQIISGNLQLLSMETRELDGAQRRIAAAMEGVTRGAKLASQLLAFARRQPLQPAVINPGRLIRSMSELLRRALGAEADIEVKIDDDLWNTLVDPNQLENVILNLAINARDAMADSGRLIVRASNFIVRRSRPGISEGEYVLVSVADTGSGMGPDVLEHAFEPFFTTKPDGKGTGLGLSMAYGFVKQSGGHIEIDSMLGSGTTINIFLPRAREAEAECTESARDTVDGGNETILVVEDEPGVRVTTVEMLTRLGYRILQAEDGKSALDIIRSGEPIDLIFSDVVMPGGVRGPELARQAREMLPQVRILFASGYAEGDLARDGKLDPDVILLSKPYSGDVLARQIRRMLAVPDSSKPDDRISA